MKTKKELIENYEDSLFALMMYEVAVAEGKKAAEENERLQTAPAAEVPQEISARCIKTIKRKFKHDQRRIARQFTLKALNRVAVAVAVMAVLFTTAFAASEEFRVRTLNLVVEVFDEGTEFRFGQVVTETPVGDNFALDLTPWLPEGSVLVSSNFTDTSGRVLYENESENYLRARYLYDEESGEVYLQCANNEYRRLPRELEEQIGVAIPEGKKGWWESLFK